MSDQTRPTGSLTVHYIAAVGLPIVGLVLGIVRLSKQDIGNGLGLVITSVVAFGIWAAIFTS